MRRMVGNLAAVAVAVSVVAAEGILRAVVTLPLQRTEPEVSYLPHTVRRFTLRPTQSAYTYGAPTVADDRGFRVNGPAVGRVEAGPTVFALGDSFTFGLGVRDEETWPTRVEARLRETTGNPVTVINGGTISYGCSRSWIFCAPRVSRHDLRCRPRALLERLHERRATGPPVS